MENLITQLRKAKNWSQDELAKEIDTSRVMIGKYERGDNSPSIEVIVKRAKAFDVSVDYLLGEGLNATYDKETVKRLDELESLPDDEKQRIFHYMDLIIRDYKTKKRITLNNKSPYSGFCSLIATNTFFPSFICSSTNTKVPGGNSHSSSSGS